MLLVSSKLQHPLYLMRFAMQSEIHFDRNFSRMIVCVCVCVCVCVHVFNLESTGHLMACDEGRRAAHMWAVWRALREPGRRRTGADGAEVAGSGWYHLGENSF